jgi:hypothetical protein
MPAGGSFDIRSALEALDADALRPLFLEALAALEPGPRTQLEDARLRHAVKAGAGGRSWRSSAPLPDVDAFLPAWQARLERASTGPATT